MQPPAHTPVPSTAEYLLAAIPQLSVRNFFIEVVSLADQPGKSPASVRHDHGFTVCYKPGMAKLVLQPTVFLHSRPQPLGGRGTVN